MSLLRNKSNHLRLVEDWPGEGVLLQLVQRASRLFVRASTAFGYMNGHDPRTRLDLILQGGIASDAEVALDSLYIAALESSGLLEDGDFVRAFRDILGVVLIARQPLSSVGIDALLQRPEHIPSMHTTSLLACLLQQSPTICVLHPSFADFLTTKNRCKREALISPHATEIWPFTACAEWMQS
jgi:hypothetical protein